MQDSILFTKSKSFALRIIKLYKYMNDELHEYVLSKQILRSGTSIGANISEAIYAQSTADYINKFSISLKEASETKYWLDLIQESELLQTSALADLKNECVEIIKMLTSTINTLKTKK